MNTKIDFKIQTEYEVIGQGPMITNPCQVGEWWLTPAQDYKERIPADIQQKMFQFINSGEPVCGFLIAEDMRDVREKQQSVRQKRQTPDTISVVGSVLAGIGRAVLGVVFAILSIAFDPMLIAVLPDGRWICLGTWYN